MARYSVIVFVVLLIFSVGFADTFVNVRTGKTFNGYATQKKRRNKTQVRTGRKSPVYLDLGQYEIERNYLGRKNKVYVFSIEDSINLICQSEAFEKAVTSAANQGPLFILIEIDTPGGKVSLAKRICAAITNLDNCTTVALVKNGKFGGAFSAGAIIALACDKIYMTKGTVIGAASPYVKTSSGPESIKEIYGQEIGGKFNSAWSAYCTAIAERNNRPPLLVKAMTDEDIEVVEVTEADNRLFINPANVTAEQTIVRTWSRKGSLLALTAEESKLCRIADDVVNSQQELFAKLEATEALAVNDKTAVKAKRQFQRIERKLKKALAIIKGLEEQAAEISEDIHILENEIRRVNEAVLLRNPGAVGIDSYRSGYPTRRTYELDQMLRTRYRLMEQLANVLERLIREYRKTLATIQKHPDFENHVKTMKTSLEEAETALRRIRLQYRY